MGSRVSVRLPEACRFRGDIVGLISGTLSLPLSLPTFGSLFSGASRIVLQVVLVSAIAAVAGCLLEKGRRDGVTTFAPRVGVRASIVASIVGSSLVVLAVTLSALGIGHAFVGELRVSIFALMLPQGRAFQILIVALLSIPPAIFFGATSSILAAMRWVSAAEGQGRKSAEQRLAGSPLAASIWMISIAGLLSPFSLALRPKPAPKAAASPILAALAAAPVPPPKWRYQKPQAFDTAQAKQVAVTDVRHFGGVEGALPVALSPDERLFAYFTRSSRPAIEIRDLDDLDVVARSELPDEPISLAWSPESTRLLIQTGGTHRRLHVIRLGAPELVTLPQPVGFRIPEGRPEWIEGDAIAFWLGTAPALVSLDTLRPVDIESSSRWGEIRKKRENGKGAGSTRLPANPRWEMEPALSIQTYEFQANGASMVDGGLHLAVSDQDRSCRHTFPQIDLKIGDLLVGTRDGSKFLRIRDGNAAVFYFGIRDDPMTKIDVSMPSAPDASMREPVAKMNACAFVCAPLVNPLNGETIGPDRTRVKGLARFKSWSEKKAELWVEEGYLPVSQGDVIADFHTWTERRPQLVGELGKSEWFAVIDKMGPGHAPSRSEAAGLDRQLAAVLDNSSGADRLAKMVPLKQQSVSTPTQTIPSQLPVPDPAGIPPQIESQIRAFITLHHTKSSRNDIEGLVADYADRVDHFDNGFVDKAFIRKDESAYHALGTRVTERIIVEPKLSRIDTVTFDASYSISFLRLQGQRWTSGDSDLELRIILGNTGPQIIRQRGETRNLKKGP
jgi:hypothetical protein